MGCQAVAGLLISSIAIDYDRAIGHDHLHDAAEATNSIHAIDYSDLLYQPLPAAVLGALPRDQKRLALASHAALGMYLFGV